MSDRNPSPGGEAETCAGKSCQSCTAGVIADCVAVCCCPCAVVNILTLALVKLPWAVARKCLGRRKMKRRDGIMESEGTPEIVVNQLNEHFSGEFIGEEAWVELGQLGFGRLSFTGIPFQHKSD